MESDFVLPAMAYRKGKASRKKKSHKAERRRTTQAPLVCTSIVTLGLACRETIAPFSIASHIRRVPNA